MSQSRAASLVEASANVVAGFSLALAVQLMVFPVFGFHPTLPQNLKIGLIFTATSLARSYAIGRLFERWPAAAAVAWEDNDAGRKPKPTALKIIEGNPGKRPIRGHEPKPMTTQPTCPAHLSPTAKAEWKRLAQTLNRVGLLTQADRAALAAYCQAYGGWVEAERKLAETPTLLKTPAGYVQPSPWLGIANKQLELMAKFMGELGLTPSARSRVTVQNPSLRKPWEFDFDDDDLLAKPSY